MPSKAKGKQKRAEKALEEAAECTRRRREGESIEAIAEHFRIEAQTVRDRIRLHKAPKKIKNATSKLGVSLIQQLLRQNRLCLIMMGLWLAFTGGANAAMEMREVKRYGAFCQVGTTVDLLTDHEGASLTCTGERRGTIIQIDHYPKGMLGNFVGLKLTVRAGIQYLGTSTVAVALRVYPGPVMEYQARSLAGEYAQISDQQFIASLLSQLSAGTKLVIQVGAQSDVIDITEIAEAIQDFQRRVAPSGQQTLDIPPR